MIIIFGDSITNRADDLGNGGWTSRLWQTIRVTHFVDHEGIKVAKHSLMELGIGGDTIVGISKRIESELKTRIDITKSQIDDVIVGIAVGINDSRFNRSLQTEEVPLETFKETYQLVVDQLNEIGIKPFLVGITPCNQKLCDPVLYTENLDTYQNDRIRKYDRAVFEIAQKKGLIFVDIFERFSELVDELGEDIILPDGLHPNSIGHQLIADCVYEKIKPII
ncbi:MAG: GDSL-type esterase/lipase family protein [Acidimicrobiia bacterium]